MHHQIFERYYKPKTAIQGNVTPNKTIQNIFG
jgi:hypothetical protein